MEQMQHGASPSKKRRKRCVLLSVAVVLFGIAVLAIVLGLTLRQPTNTFKTTFIARCEQFTGNDCEKIWVAFEQAYVGHDACKVPMEAYDHLVTDMGLFKLACNRMMFWSKTKDVVHDFTKKRDCFVTLEDTLLGSVLDSLTWCGKEGSSDTFTTGCPEWNYCENNPVRSFWKSASSAFANVACGNVTAMLNGSISTPFHPASIFGSIEVKRLNSTRTRSLNVVLVTQKNMLTNCTNASLKDLEKELDDRIKYTCKEVTESQIQDCSSNEDIPCGACW